MHMFESIFKTFTDSLETKKFPAKTSPIYKRIMLWVGPDGKEIFRGDYSDQFSVIPPVNSTVVIGPHSGLITAVHLNYNTNTKNGDHIVAKITMRKF